MTVSVIITTKNEETNIFRLLSSLKKQSFGNFEVIVVDNFSGDKTASIAKKFTKKVYQKGPERSTQRNFGLKKAKGKFVLFLDADMTLEPNVIKDCLKEMNKNPKPSSIIINEESKGHSFLAKVKKFEKQLISGIEEIEAPRFFEKKDLIKIGGYDENLIAGEDWDLATRIKKNGSFGRIKSKIYHIEGNSILAEISKKYYYAKSIKLYRSKNPKDFKNKSGLSRVILLINKPSKILTNPLLFFGLILLKLSQYITYLVAHSRVNAK